MVLSGLGGRQKGRTSISARRGPRNNVSLVAPCWEQEERNHKMPPSSHPTSPARMIRCI